LGLVWLLDLVRIFRELERWLAEVEVFGRSATVAGDLEILHWVIGTAGFGVAEGIDVQSESKERANESSNGECGEAFIELADHHSGIVFPDKDGAVVAKQRAQIPSQKREAQSPLHNEEEVNDST